MRAKLLDAAMRVFGERNRPNPVIDDVIREAKVSRGTFYKYFDSLEQLLVALGQELSNQTTADSLPIYDVLPEPWQRAAVGFRLFLVRALLDRSWAGFVTRADVWPHTMLVAQYMGADLERGKAAGQFSLENIDVAKDFLMGASAHAIQAISTGVDDPKAYMDASVRMAMMSLGCDVQTCDRGVAFSLAYLKAWATGELTATRPLWALDLTSEEARLFLSPDPSQGMDLQTVPISPQAGHDDGVRAETMAHRSQRRA